MASFSRADSQLIQHIEGLYGPARRVPNEPDTPVIATPARPRARGPSVSTTFLLVVIAAALLLFASPDLREGTIATAWQIAERIDRVLGRDPATTLLVRATEGDAGSAVAFAQALDETRVRCAEDRRSLARLAIAAAREPGGRVDGASALRALRALETVLPEETRSGWPVSCAPLLLPR